MNSDENSTEITKMASSEDIVADDSDSEDDEEDLKVSTQPPGNMYPGQLNVFLKLRI